MGEVVMKKLFSKDNFVTSTFDKKQLKQSLITNCLLVVFFVISSFTFLNMLYAFVDVIGSIVSGSPDVAIKDLLRSVPIFLCFFMSCWTLLLLHGYYRNASDERRKKSLKKNSIALVCFGFVNFLYILIGRFTGQYLSLVEGAPSYIYPLDAFLYSIFYICLGGAIFFYGRKIEESGFYIVPSRGPIVTKARFAYCFFVSIWMLFALYCFSGFWVGLFIIDFSHGYGLYGFALLLVMLINFLFLAIWELYYNELKEEKRKELLLPLALIALCVSVVVTAFYFIVLGSNTDAPANMGYGVLPIAFAASVNIATLLMVLVPVIVSVVALIKGLRIRKK